MLQKRERLGSILWKKEYRNIKLVRMSKPVKQNCHSSVEALHNNGLVIGPTVEQTYLGLIPDYMFFSPQAWGGRKKTKNMLILTCLLSVHLYKKNLSCDNSGNKHSLGKNRRISIEWRQLYQATSGLTWQSQCRWSAWTSSAPLRRWLPWWLSPFWQRPHQSWHHAGPQRYAPNQGTSSKELRS